MKGKNMRNTIYILALIIASVSFNINAQTFTNNFFNGYDGWTGDFADYPITDSLHYQLTFDRTKLPAPLDTNTFSLMMSGINHSDDLMMFIKRKISGLIPNTVYNLKFSIDVASKYPTHAAGIGGAPGEAVKVIVNAAAVEPNKIIIDNYFRLNLVYQPNDPPIDSTLQTIGHVGVEDTTTVYTIVNRNNLSDPFKVKTDSNGEVWVLIGTDSGFEGTTTLYYSWVDLTFSIVTGVDNNEPIPNRYLLLQNYPNPFNPTTMIEYEIPENDFVSLKVYDIIGNEIAELINNYQTAGKYNIAFDGKNLSNGVYIYKLTVGNYSQARKMLLLK